MELDCGLSLRDGRVLRGHLITTVFYLEQGTSTRKLVAKVKLRGEPGQTWEDLRYPVRVVREAPATERRLWRASLVGDAWRNPEPALVMARPTTLAVPVHRVEGRTYAAEADGEDPVWAVRDGASIHVGWPGGADTGVTARVASAVRDARDFFDGRQLLGVNTGAAPESVCSLVLMSREGRTTLGGSRTQPWRLEVWRWRLAADGQNLLAARAVLFRGIRGPNDPLPEIVLHPEWSIGTGRRDEAVELRREARGGILSVQHGEEK